MWGAAMAWKRRHTARALGMAQAAGGAGDSSAVEAAGSPSGGEGGGAVPPAAVQGMSAGAFALLVLQGHARLPHTTAELRRQLFLTSAYLQTHFPASVLQRIEGRFAQSLEAEDAKGKVATYFAYEQEGRGDRVARALGGGVGDDEVGVYVSETCNAGLQ